MRNVSYTYRKFLTCSSMSVLQYVAIQREEKRKKGVKMGNIQLFVFSEITTLNTVLMLLL